MARFLAFFFSLFLLIGIPQPALPVESSTLEKSLREHFQAADLGDQARLAVYVAGAEHGIPYVTINANEPRRPASVLKLVTSAAALDLLGPERTFETRVVTWNPPDRQGTINGNVVVVGGGDPALGPRFQQTKPSDILRTLRGWAQKLRQQGVRSIDGHVLGDDRRYKDEPHGLGWDKQEYGEWYSAEVGPLAYNDNCVDFIWKASGKTGRRADYRLNPQTDYVTVSSTVRVAAEMLKKPRLRYYRFKDNNEIRARGQMPPDSEKYDFAAVHDPARYTAHLFMKTLRQEGIKVSGTAYNRRQLSAIDDPTTEPLTLVRQESPPLSRLLPVINAESQNLYAEMMLREVALEQGEPASFEGGARAVKRWLRTNDLHRNGLAMVDGSGLSPVNRITPRQVADVLRFMGKHPQAGLYRDSLAIPGTRTMSTRFSGSEYEPLSGRLAGKTGYLEGAHTIAGYLKNFRGTEYVFSIMVNDFDEDRTQEARRLLDSLVLRLYRAEVLP